MGKFFNKLDMSETLSWQKPLSDTKTATLPDIESSLSGSGRISKKQYPAHHIFSNNFLLLIFLSFQQIIFLTFLFYLSFLPFQYYLCTSYLQSKFSQFFCVFSTLFFVFLLFHNFFVLLVLYFFVFFVIFCVFLCFLCFQCYPFNLHQGIHDFHPIYLKFY